MTYTIEQLKRTYSDGTLAEWWWPLDWFEDKALAEKELNNLNRRWVASDFRLTEL